MSSRTRFPKLLRFVYTVEYTRRKKDKTHFTLNVAKFCEAKGLIKCGGGLLRSASGRIIAKVISATRQSDAAIKMLKIV